MVLGCQKSLGTSFEASRTPRARALGRRRFLQRAFERLQKALWRFQGALGRLQKVLEGFWAENIDFSLVFEGFGGVSGWARLEDAGNLGPPKTLFFEDNRKTVKHLGKEQITHAPAQSAMADIFIGPIGDPGCEMG